MSDQTTIPQQQSKGRIREEVSLRVQEELSIAGITEASFAALKSEVDAIKDMDINNDKDLGAMQAVITKCVRMKSAVADAIAPGKKWAHSLHKAYTSNENEFIGTIEKIAAPLLAKKAAYVGAKEQAELERAQAEEARIRERLVAIEKYGFTRRTGAIGMDDHYANAGGTVLTMAQVTTSAPDEWANMLRGIETAWKEEQDRVRLLEEERLERERKLAEERADLERREKAMNDAVKTIRKNELLALGCVEATDFGADYIKVVYPLHGDDGPMQSNWSLPVEVLSSYDAETWNRVLADVKWSLAEAAQLRKEAIARVEMERALQESERARTGELQELGADRIEYPALPLHQYDEEAWQLEVGLVKNRVEVRKQRQAAQKLAEEEAVRVAYAKKMKEEAQAQAEAEAARKLRLSDVERWDEWMQAIEDSAPTLASAQGTHAVKHLLSYIKDKYAPSVRLELKK